MIADDLFAGAGGWDLAAAELGIRPVALFSGADANSRHTRKADEVRPLRCTGARAYLDIEQIVAAARDGGCDAIHPGYGFLSENAAFARRYGVTRFALAGFLKKKGPPPFAGAPGGDRLFRVQVGPYEPAKTAEAAKKKLEHEGFKSILKK